MAGSAADRGFVDATGPAARFNGPTGVAADGAGNVYVADSLGNRIRKVTASGAVTTFAGSGARGATDGAAATASFTMPSAVAIDAKGTLYVLDGSPQLIRKIAPDGVVSTFFRAESFSGFGGITVDSAGTVYVTDYGAGRILKITPGGLATTLAGGGPTGNTDGVGPAAAFKEPAGIAVDTAGNVYVADTGNGLIRKIAQTGAVTTLAGSAAGRADAAGRAAQFTFPRGVAVDAAGNVYVADISGRIQKVTASGAVTTIAGTDTRGVVDGPGPVARFTGPAAIAASTSGDLYVADGFAIRKLTPSPTGRTHA